MNDREFIELLNLYVDQEIGAEDASRLEAAVLGDPKRREIYDQYCRMQKACTQISEEMAAEAAEGGSTVVAFPQRRRWSLGPLIGGLAAAAAVALVFLNMRGPGVAKPEALGLAPASPVAVNTPLAGAVKESQDSMKPVFLIGHPASQAAAGRENGFLLTSLDSSGQVAQLNWIGDVRLAPVFSGTDRDFLLNPRTDLKAAVIADPQGGRDDPVPAEMAAFRFQR
jgi:hypothetical protein